MRVKRWSTRPAHQQWSGDQDRVLEEWLERGASFMEITIELNRLYPDRKEAFTRNGVIGRAGRCGFKSLNKKRLGFGRTAPKPRTKKIKSKRPAPVMLAPVVFRPGAAAGPRDDNTMAPRPAGPSKKLVEGSAELDERRRGSLVEVIEANPLTSVPMFKTERNSCKWPTSDDVRDMQVCGEPATCGAYCARHGAVAYRSPPTRKRQGRYHKVQDMDKNSVLDDVPSVGGPEEALSIPLFLSHLESDECD